MGNASSVSVEASETHVPMKVTPKDFFLWAGAMVALYWSIISFLVLFFEYIDRAFPDALTTFYTDPYSGTIRFAMASLIVLGPLTVFLLRFIHKDIEKNTAKASLWVRRWALVFTIFVAATTIAGDLITLINTFLGGEITFRFVLKVLVVLSVAAVGFMHFYADLKGYWTMHTKQARSIGIALTVLALSTVGAGFLIIGSPLDIRSMRFDDQKQNDLSTIQWQVVNYWQSKQKLPTALTDLTDTISGTTIPVDPQSGAPYTYQVTGTLSFKVCAVFNRAGNTPSSGGTPYPLAAGSNDNWQHVAGQTCFNRTIDPQRYPPFPKPAAH